MVLCNLTQEAGRFRSTEQALQCTRLQGCAGRLWKPLIQESDVQAALAYTQNILQGPSNAVPAEVNMQDGFKVPLPRRPGSLPVTPRTAVSPAFALEQPGLATPALITPSAGADTSAGHLSGGTSRLANVSVGPWNGAPCTEDDPLAGASSAGTAAPAQAKAGAVAGAQEGAEQQSGQGREEAVSVAEPGTMLARNGEHAALPEDQLAAPMELDKPGG